MRESDSTSLKGEYGDSAQQKCRVIIVGHNVLFDTLLKNYIESNLDMTVIIVGQRKANRALLLVPDDANQNIVELINACGKTWTELSSILDRPSGNIEPSTKVALFNVDPESDFQSKALQWGVKGLIYSSSPPEMFVKAIQCVARGEIWAPRKELERCVHDGSSVSSVLDLRSVVDVSLSEREVGVLSLMANGHSNKTISERLCISEHTVKKHLSNIFRRIGVSNRFQATLWVAKRVSKEL
jgi:DNA-binding NarL/FixJ family response regulator